MSLKSLSKSRAGSLTLASALALAILPQSFNRPFAIPVSVALVGLGYSLWHNRVDTSTTAAATRGVATGTGPYEPVSQ